MIFGLFDMFGKSKPMTALETALREAGLHPALAPDSVKLTLLRLLGGVSRTPPPDQLTPAAELLAFCLQGRRDFEIACEAERAEAVEARLEAALNAPDALDAQIIMLALASGEANPDIADRFEAETAE